MSTPMNSGSLAPNKTQRSAVFSRRSPQASSPPSMSMPSGGGGGGGASGAAQFTSTDQSQRVSAMEQNREPSGLSQNFPTSDAIPPISSAPSTSPRGERVAKAGGGLVDVNKTTAAILELTFSILAFTAFISLWIYLLVVDCFRDKLSSILLKMFSVSGATVSLFTLFHSCFDRRLTIGRGILGFVVFFLTNVVVFVNLVGAFMAVNCACVCPATKNAFNATTNQDLIIFCLELIASVNLVIVLIVSAVVHK